ncbi:hypothetical protein JRI60_27245 [Archangium violaceum]|uniref:hypothetical protein n=1 Tax=Archangium violaceum TaxID=83451 RepID=UPI001952838C|nr:hypothetical protein [Archangium violaceum]QRN92909.1 hypothetical protein JRI60_27245 [Archangium violaceum]
MSLVLASPFGGPRRLDPSACRTPLKETHGCHGWDDSFTECRFFFRAEGVPARELCERFLREPTSGAPAQSEGDASSCIYADERGWTRVDCERLGLGADFTCFYCRQAKHEASNEFLQAFSPECERGVILRSCNVSLESEVARERERGEQVWPLSPR